MQNPFAAFLLQEPIIYAYSVGRTYMGTVVICVRIIEIREQNIKGSSQYSKITDILTVYC